MLVTNLITKLYSSCLFAMASQTILAGMKFATTGTRNSHANKKFHKGNFWSNENHQFFFLLSFFISLFITHFYVISLTHAIRRRWGRWCTPVAPVWHTWCTWLTPGWWGRYWMTWWTMALCTQNAVILPTGKCHISFVVTRLQDRSATHMVSGGRIIFQNLWITSDFVKVVWIIREY